MRHAVPALGAPLRHPGPRAEKRVVSAGGAPVALRAEGRAGEALTEVLGRAAGGADVTGGIFRVAGLALGPFSYVTPDAPPMEDDRHVAWYSDPVKHPMARLTDGSATLGLRDGAWWLHIHARWPGGVAGVPGGGHLLPETLVLAEDTSVDGVGVAGAGFEVRLDPETEFPLFRVAGGGEGAAAVATLAPGIDLTEGLEALAARHCKGRPARAVGLCSFAGAAYADAPGVTQAWISESFLTGARIGADGRGVVRASGVDIRRTESDGALIRGKAPILVTAELLILPEDMKD